MLSEARFLDVMAATPAPVTVVTTTSPSGPSGSTVSAFMSLSLRPMLVVVALDKRSRMLPLIESTRRYGVNLMAAEQTDTALTFARSGPDKFKDTVWRMDHGLPRLEHTAAWLACDLESVIDSGDHKLLVGTVVDVSCAPLSPLVYSYRLFGTHSKAQQRFRTPIEAHVAALARYQPPPLKPMAPRLPGTPEHRIPDVVDSPVAGVPSDAELVERVRAISQVLGENAAHGEASPNAMEAAVQALTKAGLFKLAVPRRYGGYETSMKAMLDVTSAIAEYDGGTAWAVGLINVCCWITGLFCIQAQDEVWAENPDAKVTGVFTPSGESAKADGGYLVSGRWYYNWGSWPSEWAVVGFPRSDAEGAVVDYSFALIPMSELRLADTRSAGTDAAEGNCLIANRVFVPEHRILSATEANNGSCRNELADREPLYRSALMPVLILTLIGPQLGLARKALRMVRSQASQRAVSGTVYERQSDSVAFQLRLARAALMIDTAHLHAYRAAEEIDAAARAGEYPEVETRARIHGDAGWIAENIRGAIDTLMTAHGTGSRAESSSLEHIWRYAAIAGLHALVTPDVQYETYGKALLGIEEAIVPLL